MRRRTLVASVCLAALTGGVVPVQARGTCSSFGYDDKCEERSALLNSRVDFRMVPLYAPSSQTLVAAGLEYEEGTTSVDAQVNAFEARTGRRTWSRSFGRSGRPELFTVSALGPGGTVVVAGSSGLERKADWLVAALSVRTGRVLWKRTYGGGGEDTPAHVVADPRHDAVYVAGDVTRRRVTAALVAYDASSGRRLWVREMPTEKRDHYVQGLELRGPDLYLLELGLCRVSRCESGPTLTRARPSPSGFGRVWERPVNEKQTGSLEFGPDPLQATPDGVLVAGTTFWFGDTPSYGLVFYDRRSALKRWTAIHDVTGEPQVTFPVLASDRWRKQVVVGEVSAGTSTHVVAYSTNGRKQWEAPFPQAGFPGTITDVAAGRAGVYVTGAAEGRNQTLSAATVHLGPASGRRRWIARYASGRWDEGIAGLLRAVPGGAAVTLAAPSNGRVRSGEDWIGVATYRNRE
jgi:outer membrane protein assembly factor BamB